MKFAPVLPVSLAGAVSTGYNICFAELILQYPEYCKVFRQRVDAGEFVLMDSLVFEHKYPLPLSEWMRAVRMLRPTAATSPDIWCDETETFNLFRTVNVLFREQGLFEHTKLFAVAQATTTVGCAEAARRLAPHTDYIALKVHLPKDKYVDRVHLMQLLESWGVLRTFPNLRFHMLGAGFVDFRDAIALRKHSRILGIDTAKPVCAGLNGHIYGPGSNRTHTRRPENYFDLQVSSDDPRVPLVLTNVSIVSHWITHRGIRRGPVQSEVEGATTG